MRKVNEKFVNKRKYSNVISWYQEYLIIFNNHYRKFIVWDIITEEAVHINTLRDIKNTVVYIEMDCSDLYNGGIILLDDK